MKIKIWDINKSKESLEFDYTEDFSYLLKEFGQLKAISLVKVKGTASKTADFYTIKGSATSELQIECSRCLNYFDYVLECYYEEIFVPEDIETNFDLYVEDNIHLLDSEEIDLTRIIEEAILLNIPYAPICSEDCKGLCPTCGTNLNEKTCSCKDEKIDPRLADLANWFD